MQIQNDGEPIQISSAGQTDVNSDMEDECGVENPETVAMTPSKKIKIDKNIYSGAFAFSSPPEHVMLSDYLYPEHENDD